MNHPNEDLLALAAADDLSLWRRWRVHQHLKTCAECREVVEAYHNLRVCVSALPVPEPPVDLAESILSRIPRNEPQRHRIAWMAWPATAALAAAGVIAFMVVPEQPQVPPPGPVVTIVTRPAVQPITANPVGESTNVAQPSKPAMEPLARFTTVAEAELDRDSRYLQSFAAQSGLQRAPQLDRWSEQTRMPDRQLPQPVVNMRAEILRSHALPAQVQIVPLTGSPLQIVSAEALFAEGRLIDPVVEVRNSSSHMLDRFELVWTVTDASGSEYRGRIVSNGKPLAPGQKMKLAESIVLESQEKRPESAIASARVFVRSTTNADKSVWVPDRTQLEAKNLGGILPVHDETKRKLEAYRRSGVQALLLPQAQAR